MDRADDTTRDEAHREQSRYFQAADTARPAPHVFDSLDSQRRLHPRASGDSWPRPFIYDGNLSKHEPRTHPTGISVEVVKWRYRYELTLNEIERIATERFVWNLFLTALLKEVETTKRELENEKKKKNSLHIILFLAAKDCVRAIGT